MSALIKDKASVVETHPAKPLVSVIIPAFNRERVIGKAIKSVLAQTFQDFEIIVIDDGSCDETAKKAIKLACSEPRVRIFRSETNQGAQAARNAGARAAQGKWLAFLDSDDEWLPRSLEMRLGIAAVENVEVVHSDCYVLGKNMPQELFNVPALRGKVYSELLGHPGPMFQAMLISADSFRQIGGFDETIVAYQEWDTAIRLGKSFRFGYVNAPTFVYNCQGTDTISKDERRAAQGYKQVVRKHLLPIMFKLGPRAISKHYRVIARHYFLAGEAKQARISSLSAFLWWPSLGVRSYARLIKRNMSGMIVRKTHNEQGIQLFTPNEFNVVKGRAK
jgi:glycosyltransferase involved in cell wall biosynthesis